jgi:MFS family permease
LRFLVGFGLAAGVTPALTIVVEQTPTRWRTGMTSFFVVFASAGTLLAGRSPRRRCCMRSVGAAWR